MPPVPTLLELVFRHLLRPMARAVCHPTRRGVASALAAGPVALLAYILLLIPLTPGIGDIRKANLDQPAQILFADGKKLTEFKQSNREWVALADIAPAVIDALIATEDHRFFEHHGIDWRRTAGAAVRTFGGDRQGGSTLTQQLARNLYPEQIGRAPTLTRKLKEAITAFKIEAVHSKEEILETYLNTVPFLYNAFGIEMAARTYFGTSAGQLDTLQSATLVGMLKGNSYYNPVSNPERSVQRRNIVLAQMVKRGKLAPARFELLKKQALRIDFERQLETPGPAPHFARQLRKWLIDWADRNDYNLYRDGLIVHTTLDSRLQTLANQSVGRQIDKLQTIANSVWSRRSVWGSDTALTQSFMRESADYRTLRASGLPDEDALHELQGNRTFMLSLRQQKTRIEAGFLALDPQTGQVKAWVGSSDFEQDAFDHVQQARRQPGSTFKPFVYGEAFRQGMKPDATLLDQAVEIPVGGSEVWRPTDGKPASGRAMSLADALAQSKNTVTAQLMMKVGPASVARLARRLGVRESPLEAVPSLALGTSPVTLKEMVSAYGSIADGGTYREPQMLTRIEDRDGQLIEELSPAEPERALDERVAYTLLDSLRGVIDRGTGRAIRSRFGVRADVAGKTGTTQDNADGWFILMHRQLVAGVWVGFNDGRVTLRSDYWGQGAHSALPIVGDVIHGALRGRLIDAKVRLATPEDNGLLQRWSAGIGRWWRRLHGERRPPPAPTEIRRGATVNKPAPASHTASSEPTEPAATPEADPLDALIERLQQQSEAGTTDHDRPQE